MSDPLSWTGCRTRDFICLEDVVEAGVLSIGSSCQGIFNVGTGVETCANDLLAHIQRFTGKFADPENLPATAVEQRRGALDAARITRQLGWKRRTSLVGDLAQTVARLHDVTA